MNSVAAQALTAGRRSLATAAALLLVLPAFGTAQDRECRCDDVPRVRIGQLDGPLLRYQALAFPRARIGVSLGGSEQDDHPDGAYVQDVTEGAPAEAAGIRAGDVIVAVDGHRLTDPLDADEELHLREDGNVAVERLMALASEWEAGDDVEITYLRDGRETTVTMEAEESEFGGRYGFQMEELGERMREMGPRIRAQMAPLRELENLRELHGIERDGPGRVWIGEAGEGNAFSFLFGLDGMELRTLNPDMSSYFGTDEGVLVMDVDDDSSLGLMAGDVILSIGGRSVDDPSDVRRILRSYDDGEAVRFEIMRDRTATTAEGTVRN